MAKFFMIFGIVLIVLAAFVLFFGTQFLDNPTVVSVLQGIYCKPGETMRIAAGPEEYDPLNNLGAQPVYFSCVSASGQVTDLGSGPFNSIVAAYFVPFIVGMLMTMLGWSSQRGKKLAQARLKNSDVKPYVSPWRATAAAGSGMTVASGTPADQLSQLEGAHRQGLISDHDYDELREALDMPDAKPVSAGSGGAADALEAVVDKLAAAGAEPFSGNLTTRLKQLEEARTRGLITDDEYRLGRQILLDSAGG